MTPVNEPLKPFWNGLGNYSIAAFVNGGPLFPKPQYIWDADPAPYILPDLTGPERDRRDPEVSTAEKEFNHDFGEITEESLNEFPKTSVVHAKITNKDDPSSPILSGKVKTNWYLSQHLMYNVRIYIFRNGAGGSLSDDIDPDELMMALYRNTTLHGIRVAGRATAVAPAVVFSTLVMYPAAPLLAGGGGATISAGRATGMANGYLQSMKAAWTGLPPATKAKILGGAAGAAAGITIGVAVEGYRVKGRPQPGEPQLQDGDDSGSAVETIRNPALPGTEPISIPEPWPVPGPRPDELPDAWRFPRTGPIPGDDTGTGTGDTPKPKPEPQPKPRPTLPPGPIDITPTPKTYLYYYFATGHPNPRNGILPWLGGGGHNPAWPTGYYLTDVTPEDAATHRRGQLSFALFSHPYEWQGAQTVWCARVRSDNGLSYWPYLHGVPGNPTPTSSAVFGDVFSGQLFRSDDLTGHIEEVFPVSCFGEPGADDMPAGTGFPTDGNNGNWLGTTPGNSVWRSTDSRILNVLYPDPAQRPDHIDVQFHNGYPEFTPWLAHPEEWSSGTVTFRPIFTGDDGEDFPNANRIIAQANDWFWNGQPNATAGGNVLENHIPRLTWHHYEDMRTLMMVPTVLNQWISHRGGATHARLARW